MAHGAGRSDEGVVDEHAQAVAQYRVVVAGADRLAAVVVADAAEVAAELAQSLNAVASSGKRRDVLADPGSRALIMAVQLRARRATVAAVNRAPDRLPMRNCVVRAIAAAAAGRRPAKPQLTPLIQTRFAVGGDRDRHPSGRGEARASSLAPTAACRADLAPANAGAASQTRRRRA